MKSPIALFFSIGKVALTDRATAWGGRVAHGVVGEKGTPDPLNQPG